MTNLDTDFEPDEGFTAWLRAMGTDRLESLESAVRTVRDMLTAYSLSTNATMDEAQYTASMAQDLRQMEGDIHATLSRRPGVEDLPF